ncbi:hypothetical protein GGR58DRAFT_381811 [Xylaria digitata]|nr:hypothetical protein GGR58DRAFT_381811 [Xylaria digitata]
MFAPLCLASFSGSLAMLPPRSRTFGPTVFEPEVGTSVAASAASTSGAQKGRGVLDLQKVNEGAHIITVRVKQTNPDVPVISEGVECQVAWSHQSRNPPKLEGVNTGVGIQREGFHHIIQPPGRG